MPRFALLVVLSVLCSSPAAAQGASEPANEENAAADSERIAVAVDVTELNPLTQERVDALSLETRIIQRLLQEGFAVVAPFSEADVNLVLREPEIGTIELVARSANSEEVLQVPLGKGTRAEMQLELSQRLVGLARAQADAVLKARREAAKKGEKPPARLIPIRPAPPPEPPVLPEPELDVGVDLDVGVFALWRVARVDPLFAAGASFDLKGPLSLAVRAGYSTSSSDLLIVRELQLLVGPRVQLFRSYRLSAHAGVLVGVLSHGFTLRTEGISEPIGGRLDFLIEVPFDVRYRFAPWNFVGVRVAPGLSGYAREHVLDGQVLWRSGLARVEAGAFAGVRF